MLKYSYCRKILVNRATYIIHLNDLDSKFKDSHKTLGIHDVYKNFTIYNNTSYISFFIGFFYL